MRVVITQSMLFPWVGLLEQIRLADVVVHYDDVQFSKGSYVNRIQLKMPAGRSWMTVPLAQLSLGQVIDEVKIDQQRPWQSDHRTLLQKSLGSAANYSDAAAVLDSVYKNAFSEIGPLARASLMASLRYFGLDQDRKFLHVDELGIPGSSSDRVLAVVKAVGGTEYITGHGAKNYLDHEGFERAGVSVGYIDYALKPYPQLHGDFTPYVSCLDLIANMGRRGEDCICSRTIEWREFLGRSA